MSDRSGVAALLAALLALSAPPAAAQLADEFTVKAAFLMRFGAFTTWPAAALPEPTSPLNICVLGRRPLYDKVAGAAQSANDGRRPLTARYLTAVDERRGCHVLYIAATADLDAEDNLAAIDSEPILTITDERNGATRGAIHFVVIDNRVRFHVDLRHTQDRNLRLDPRLLALAVSVRGAR